MTIKSLRFVMILTLAAFLAACGQPALPPPTAIATTPHIYPLLLGEDAADFTPPPDMLPGTDGEGYRLDPALEIETIVLSYTEVIEFWSPVMQGFVAADGRGGYARDGGRVASGAQVNMLVKALDGLYPSDSTLYSLGQPGECYDCGKLEYSQQARMDEAFRPELTFRIRLDNGENLILTSQSISDTYAPWNIIYRGQVFVQFDRQLNGPLSRLFGDIPNLSTITETQARGLGNLRGGVLDAAAQSAAQQAFPPGKLDAYGLTLAPTSDYYAVFNPDAGGLQVEVATRLSGRLRGVGYTLTLNFRLDELRAADWQLPLDTIEELKATAISDLFSSARFRHERT